MSIYFDRLLQIFFRYRKPFALAFFFFGAPFTYFLREFIGLAPGSIVFTGVFTFGPLLMAAPFFTLNRLYAPHKQAMFFYLVYGVFCFFYMISFAPNRGWFTRTEVEIVYFIVWLGVVFLFMSISVNEIKDNFLEFVVLICIISSMALVYAVLTNPMAAIGGGTRAAIEVKVNAEQGGGSTSNPHIFAKSAYAGIVAVFLLFRKYPKLLHRAVLLGLCFFFIAILGLTQSMQSILTAGLFFGVYAFFQLTPKNILNIFRWIFGVQGLIFFSSLTYGIYYIWEKTRYDEIIIATYEFIIGRIERIFATITRQKMTSLKEVDFSAGGRMETIGIAVDQFKENIADGNWLTILFGNGYQHFYVDSPVIQSVHDLGIFGGIIFFSLHFWVISIMIKEFRRPTLLINSFICYFILLIIINQIAGGMPYDYTRYVLMAFMFRFCLPHSSKFISQSQLKTA